MYHVTYIENLKVEQTSEYNNRETDSQIQNKLLVPMGRGKWGNGQGIKRHKLLCII